MFLLKINSYFVKLCIKTFGTSRFRIEAFNSNLVKCSIWVAWQYRSLSQQNPQLFKYLPLLSKICFIFTPTLYQNSLFPSANDIYCSKISSASKRYLSKFHLGYVGLVGRFIYLFIYLFICLSIHLYWFSKVFRLLFNQFFLL